jgi:hypothetical protein
MKISDVTYTPTYFDTYISQVADLHLSEALQQSLEVIDALDRDKLHAIGDQNHHIRIMEERYFPMLQTA